VGWFYDSSQKKHVLAHNIISTHYFTGRFHVPLDFDIYIKEEDCKNDDDEEEEEKGGERKTRFRTKVEIAKKGACKEGNNLWSANK
jgi:hypothetical protein